MPGRYLGRAPNHRRGPPVLRDAGKKTRDTRSYVDQVAAQMILQSYLDWRVANVGSKSDQ